MRSVLGFTALAIAMLASEPTPATAQATCYNCAMFGSGFFCWDPAVIGYRDCEAYNSGGMSYCRLNDPCQGALDLTSPTVQTALAVAGGFNVAVQSALRVHTVVAPACTIVPALVSGSPPMRLRGRRSDSPIADPQT